MGSTRHAEDEGDDEELVYYDGGRSGLIRILPVNPKETCAAVNGTAQ
jgi:hypothetical protein